ncbi:MAG: 3-phosphoshikimate 1-carboxyvinyltransferase, partial [Fidelibacterota bacterium]
MSFHGKISFRGDKSISHRALMLAALADGISRITNISQGEDVQSTLRCLRQCGIRIEGDDPVTIYGNTWSPPAQPLDCGNSGTTARLLLGLLAGIGIEATFTGDASLQRRPMDRVLTPLKQMGIQTISDAGHLPVTINGRPTQGLDYRLPVASAQVKSAILLAGLGAPETVTVREPAETRDHTERMLRARGSSIFTGKGTVQLAPGPQAVKPMAMTVPGDPSTAAFFAAAAALLPGSRVTLKNISANPTRIHFFRCLRAMGADVEWSVTGNQSGEPVGTVTVTGRKLRAFRLAGSEIPGVIDELPILAVLASQAPGVSTIRDAGELRIKESDRLKALALNLKRMGIPVREEEDGLDITGGTPLKGGPVATFHDHRIAMAFAVGGLVSRTPVVLDDPDCVRISAPEFFRTLRLFQEKG